MSRMRLGKPIKGVKTLCLAGFVIIVGICPNVCPSAEIPNCRVVVAAPPSQKPAKLPGAPRTFGKVTVLSDPLVVWPPRVLEQFGVGMPGTWVGASTGERLLVFQSVGMRRVVAYEILCTIQGTSADQLLELRGDEVWVTDVGVGKSRLHSLCAVSGKDIRSLKGPGIRENPYSVRLDYPVDAELLEAMRSHNIREIVLSVAPEHAKRVLDLSPLSRLKVESIVIISRARSELRISGMGRFAALESVAIYQGAFHLRVLEDCKQLRHLWLWVDVLDCNMSSSRLPHLELLRVSANKIVGAENLLRGVKARELMLEVCEGLSAVDSLAVLSRSVRHLCVAQSSDLKHTSFRTWFPALEEFRIWDCHNVKNAGWKRTPGG